MVERRVHIEAILDVWHQQVDGKRVVLEGLYSDSTTAVTCLATFVKKEIGTSIGLIDLDGYKLRIWPPQRTMRDSIVLGRKDVEQLNQIGAIRACILEDARVYVREWEWNNFDYLDFMLPEAIRIAGERFGQCEGDGKR